MKLLSKTTKFTLLASSFMVTKAVARLSGNLRRNLRPAHNSNINGTETISCILSSIAALPIPSQALIQEKYICTTDDDERRAILLSDDPYDILGEDFINGVTTISLVIKRLHEEEIEEAWSQLSLKDSLIWNSVDNSKNERRSLVTSEPIIGVKKVLVVRVESVDGAFKPTQSEEDLFDDIFDDDNNMAVRFDECSNGQLQMIPATGTGVTNGVTTVSIDGDLTTKDHFYCMEKARSKIATTITRDFTMIICPDVINFDGAAAYAAKPGNYSWFLSKFASIPLVQFHEMSHNFGLEHSGGLDGLSYSDPTCNLGTSGSWTDEGNHYCFNAAKTWAFHWYDNYHAEVDPLYETYDDTLVGINAVRSNTTGDNDVVLKISSTGANDLYLMYQRQVDANRDIPAYGNQVVITEQKEESLSQSYMKKALEEGDEYVQGNWGGIVGNTLTIKVCSLDATTLPGSVHVIVCDSNHKISCVSNTLDTNISTPPDDEEDESPPSPPSLPLCQDAAGRIKYNDTTRNCLFVSRKNTSLRCANDGVAEACPVTCMRFIGWQCQCEERPLYKQFNIRINGERTRKTCQDAIDDTSLCALNKVRSFCPIVCKVDTCI